MTGDVISVEQGKEKVIKLFGEDRVSSVEEISTDDTSLIKTFSYKVLFKDLPEEQNAFIDITQQGGHVLWMLYNRPVDEKTIEVDEAKELGRHFLESIGFE